MSCSAIKARRASVERTQQTSTLLPGVEVARGCLSTSRSLETRRDLPSLPFIRVDFGRPSDNPRRTGLA